MLSESDYLLAKTVARPHASRWRLDESDLVRSLTVGADQEELLRRIELLEESAKIVQVLNDVWRVDPSEVWHQEMLGEPSRAHQLAGEVGDSYWDEFVAFLNDAREFFRMVAGSKAPEENWESAMLRIVTKFFGPPPT